MEPEPFFQRDGEGLYVPSELTRVPWDGNAQHGGPPSALLAGVLESHAAEPGAA
ncbi:MAG: thioesterase family protein, partial [Solirubrobacterales bacterium]|nr:thioesterase family protein [Solirubrobacterales bacterium]